MKASAAGLCLCIALVSKGAAWEGAPIAWPARVTPVVVFETEARETIEAFAHDRGLDPAGLKRRFAATGVVQCGSARGSGQVTLAGDVLTTAAHVLYDRNGRLRGDREHCWFTIEAAGQTVRTAIEVEGAVVGSTDPYNESPVHDWAVVKLARKLREVEPYALAPGSGEGPVRFVARGAINWRDGRDASVQDCRLRSGLENGAEGTREFAFDCAAGVGASGSGLFEPRGGRLLAIFVGFRSADPERAHPFSPEHYNFAVSVEGAFRRAVERAAAVNTAAE